MSDTEPIPKHNPQKRMSAAARINAAKQARMRSIRAEHPDQAGHSELVEQQSILSQASMSQPCSDGPERAASPSLSRDSKFSGKQSLSKADGHPGPPPQQQQPQQPPSVPFLPALPRTQQPQQQDHSLQTWAQKAQSLQDVDLDLEQEEQDQAEQPQHRSHQQQQQPQQRPQQQPPKQLPQEQQPQQRQIQTQMWPTLGDEIVNQFAAEVGAPPQEEQHLKESARGSKDKSTSQAADVSLGSDGCGDHVADSTDLAGTAMSQKSPTSMRSNCSAQKRRTRAKISFQDQLEDAGADMSEIERSRNGSSFGGESSKVDSNLESQKVRRRSAMSIKEELEAKNDDEQLRHGEASNVSMKTAWSGDSGMEDSDSVVTTVIEKTPVVMRSNHPMLKRRMHPRGVLEDLPEEGKAEVVELDVSRAGSSFGDTCSRAGSGRKSRKGNKKALSATEEEPGEKDKDAGDQVDDYTRAGGRSAEHASTFCAVLKSQLDDAQKELARAHSKVETLASEALDNLLGQIDRNASDKQFFQESASFRAQSHTLASVPAQSILSPGQYRRENSFRKCSVFGNRSSDTSSDLAGADAGRSDSKRNKFPKRASLSQLALLDIWQRSSFEASRVCTLRLSSYRQKHKNLSRLDLPDEDVEEGWVLLPKRVTEKLIVEPSSHQRAGWDTLSFLFLVYDMIASPLLFFDPPKTTFASAMVWITRLFWTFDISATFLTGFINRSGNTEMRPSKIAARYVKQWFALDFILVSIDWVEILWSGFLEMARFGKAPRYVRMLRLLRVIRLRAMFELIHQRIRSEGAIILADIIRNATLIVGLAHFVACCWYGLSAQSSNGWVQAHKTEMGFEDMELSYRYFTALHWSLSQFTGGMDEVRPQNLGERIFAVVMFMFGFVGAAVFLSSATSSMTRLHILASRQSREVSALRWYLQENGISSALSTRIIRNAVAVAARFQSTTEGNVEMLKVVSDPLRMELHFELYMPVIEFHPFFQRYIHECPQVARKICHLAVKYVFLSEGDNVFSVGEVSQAPTMYIVAQGKLHYVSGHSHEEDVAVGNWCAEPALWIIWVHAGTLTTTCETKLCSVDSQMFQEVAGKYQHLSYDPRTYARDFLSFLKEFDGEITDLPFGFEAKLAFRDADYDPGHKWSGQRGSSRQSLMFNSRRRSTWGGRDSSAGTRRGSSRRSTVRMDVE